MMLQNGFFEVPRRKVAAVVTHLEMRERPQLRPAPEIAASDLVPVLAPQTNWYRDLFRKVGGEDWLWFSRLALPDADLAEILSHPDVTILVLKVEDREMGLLELDFRTPGACELAFLGVTRPMLGTGAGRMMMNAAIALAWARPIQRFHVHTCTFDHPAALAFYQRSGFTVTGREIEIADDPRLIGVLSRAAAPHVPILE